MQIKTRTKTSAQVKHNNACGRIQFEVYHTCPLSKVLRKKKNVRTNLKQRVGNFMLTVFKLTFFVLQKKAA